MQDTEYTNKWINLIEITKTDLTTENHHKSNKQEVKNSMRPPIIQNYKKNYLNLFNTLTNKC
jgi:hypothetical protein